MIDTQIVWTAFRQYYDLKRLSQSPLANMQFVKDLAWQGDTKNLAGYNVQGVLLWALERLIHGNQYEEQSAATLKGRYLDKLPVAACAAKFSLTERAVNARRQTGIKRVTELLIDANRTTGQWQADQAKFAISARYADCSKASKWWLHFWATFHKPVALIVAQQAIDEYQIQPYFSELVEKNWLIQLAGDRIQVHPQGIEFVRQQWEPEECQTHNTVAATFYEAQAQYESAIYHWQQAHQDDYAAKLLLACYKTLSIDVLKQLLASFDRERSDAAQGELKLIAGQVMVASKDLDSAIELFEEVLQVPDIFMRAQACYHLAKLYESRNVMRALRYYNQGHNLLNGCHSEEARQLQVQIWLGECWVFMSQQQAFAKAADNLIRAEEQIETEWRALRITFHTMEAELHFRQKDLKRCLDARWKAWFIANELQDKPQIINTGYNLAFNLAHHQDFDEAWRMMERVYKLAIEEGNHRVVAHSQHAFGAFHVLNQRDGQAAIPYYQEAYSYFESIDDKHRLGILCHDLAETYVIVESYQQAYDFIQRGLAIADDVDDQYVQSSLKKLARSNPALADDLSSQQRMVVAEVFNNGRIRTKRCQELLGLESSQARRYLQLLVEMQFLESVGKGRGTHYVLHPSKRPGFEKP
ncbi:MAG: hypothetical protein ACPG8W_06780 [Candidatus Promineifilaceae bacterium]